MPTDYAHLLPMSPRHPISGLHVSAVVKTPVLDCWGSWTLTATDGAGEWAGEAEVRGIWANTEPVVWVVWLASRPGLGGRGVGHALVCAVLDHARRTTTPDGRAPARLRFQECTSQGVVDLLERVVGPLVETDPREAYPEHLREMVRGPRPRDVWYPTLRRRSPAERGSDDRWSISGQAARKAVTLECRLDPTVR